MELNNNRIPSTKSLSNHQFDFFDDNVKQQNPYQQNKDEQVTLGNKRMVLFILGVMERVDFDAMPRIVLGRFEGPGKKSHQLDLTDYGAINRGVSREHCQLEWVDEKLMVTDLGSTNGTYVGGKRLEPNQPTELARGQELVVGRLPIQIISGR